MKTYTRVTRFVVRTPTNCDYCPWVMRELDPGYSRRIGGTETGRFCSRAHAERGTRGPVRCEYE